MNPLIELLRSLGLEIEADDLTTLTDEQLAEAMEALQSAYADAREAVDVEAATTAVEAIESIRAEETRREEAATAALAELEALDARAAGEPEEPEAEADPAAAEGEPETPAEETQPEAEPEAEGVPEAEPEGAEERELVTAAARTTPAVEAAHRRIQDRAARRARMPQPPAAHRGEPTPANRTTLVAGADLAGMSPGQRFRDLRQFGEATGERYYALEQALQRNPSMGGRFLVASMLVEYPEERTLTASAEENGARIEAAMRDAQSATIDSITAAGGLCAPVEVRYEMFGVGDDRRPIRDSLVRFNARRGGVRFVRPPTLGDVGGAVEIWTEANDQAPSNPATKPCLTITCGTEVEEVIDAVTKCLEVGNFSRRTFPEQFAAWWRLAGVAHAREAETQLWTRMLADTGVLDASTGEGLGAAVDILENLTQAAAAYRSRRRMAPEAVVRVIMPEWTLDVMIADIVRRAPGDDTLGITRAQVDALIRARNIAPTYTPDTGQEFGAQTDGAALLRWPTEVEMLLFAEGTYLFLDGGQLDFGMEIRDSTLNSTNDVQAFVESFEGEGFVGNEAIHLTLGICPDGSTGAPNTSFDPCTTGS